MVLERSGGDCVDDAPPSPVCSPSSATAPPESPSVASTLVGSASVVAALATPVAMPAPDAETTNASLAMANASSMALSVAVSVSSTVGTLAEVRRTMLLEAKTRFRSGIGLDRSPARLAGGAGAAAEAPVFSVAADTLGRRRRRIWGVLHPPVGELVMAVAIDCPTARVATTAAGFFGRRRRTRGTLHPPVGELVMAAAIDCPTARAATTAAGFFGRRRRTRGNRHPPADELCRPVATACPPLWVKERAELKPPAVAVTAVVIAS